MNIEYKESIWALDPDQATKDILQLEEGEHCFYPESDYGHGYILKVGDQYECWSYPMYGGEQSLEETVANEEDAFACVTSWT